MASTVLPCFPNTTRGQPTALKICEVRGGPKGKQLIYALDRVVVIRALEPEAGAGAMYTQLYTQHAYPVSAVAMAPSGCYVASGDINGVVRVWACDNPEQILKLETPVFGGRIAAIDWSMDNTRIVAVGDGKSDKAKAFMWDSGNSVGELGGHAAKINTVSYKPSRPFRVVTGADDKKVNFYSGPPFKFTCLATQHGNFVNAVAYSPNGERFLTASSDCTVELHDGKEGNKLVGEKVHKGSVYAACWSPDSSKIVTASADKSIKVLDGTSLETLFTHEFGKSPLDMQVGCAWSGTSVVAYSLGGVLSVFDGDNLQAAPKVQRGHNKPVACLLWHSGSNRLISGSYDSPDDGKTLVGAMRAWDLSSGLADTFTGDGHNSRVTALGVLKSGAVVSLGLDQTVCFSTAGSRTFDAKVSFEHCALDLGVGSEKVAVIDVKGHVHLVSSTKIDKSQKLGLDGLTCVDVAATDDLVAVGRDDNTVALLDGNLGAKHTLSLHKGALAAVGFSPDGTKLASGCANKEVVVWDPRAGTPLVTGLQGFHTARLSCLAWSPDSATLATGGVDALVIVWDLEAKAAKKKVVNAHVAGGINALAFVNKETLASAGADGCVKTWAV